MSEMLAPVEYCRALEALRNGVPNADAVKALGCNQGDAEGAFRDQLEAATAQFQNGEAAGGLLVRGDFGTGKSHLLEYLQHVALSSNFVCSHVVISKETPLHDLSKVYAAAIENAILPGHRGHAVSNLAFSLQPGSPAYDRLYRWVNSPECELGQLFGAALFLHERLNNDPELVEKIIGFWSGEKLAVSDVRQGLKQCGGAAAYSVKAIPAKDLAHQRMKFMSRLVVGAGYAGWVVLLDEVELIGRYSLQQRGKSYAELARWLGHSEGLTYPGLTAVAAITSDFSIAVLGAAGKNDLDYVGERMRAKQTEEADLLASRAELGMRLIQHQALELRRPTVDTLRYTYDQIRRIHGQGYGWEPPDLEPDFHATKFRTFVRQTINEWDLLRLFPDYIPKTVVQEIESSYEEDLDLESSSEAAPEV